MKNKKLHVLFLSSWYPCKKSLTNGVFVKNHAEAIATVHNVSVVYPIGCDDIENTYFEREKHHNITTIIIYFKRHSNPLINAWRKYKSLTFGIKKIPEFDIIHGNIFFPIGPLVLLVSKIKKKPYIITEHWTDYKYPMNKSIGYIQKKITQIVASQAEKIITVSEGLKSDLESFGIHGNYHVVGNTIDTNLFSPIIKKTNTFTLLHISTLDDKQKNISGILRVVKRISLTRLDFKIIIIASDTILFIKKLIKELAIPDQIIQIEQAKSQLELISYYHNSDVFISFSNYETFGLVVAEAIATGTPVITTNTGIVKEMESSEYLTKVKIGNEDQLLDAIIDSMQKSSNYDQNLMNKQIDSKYSKQVIANKFNQIYTEISNKH